MAGPWEGRREPQIRENRGACSTGERSGVTPFAVLSHKGENHPQPWSERHKQRPNTSLHSAAAFDLGARKEPLLDTTSSFLPRGFQAGELFPHFVEPPSCLDEAAQRSFRNHQVPARKGQDASASHAPPKVGSTTPQEQPGEPWRAPDHRYREECARESRYILSHAGWVDANGNVNFYWAGGPNAAAARSIGRTPRQSPFHWRGGAWSALLGTASANRLAV